MKFNLAIKKNKGFTLLELSIVLVIVSVLMVGGIGLGITVTKSSNKKDANSRLDVAERALANFVLENGRLPCPAPLTATPVNNSYGQEAGNPGECIDTGNVFSNSEYLVYGALPFAELKLNPSYGRDPWGHKISYVVDKRLTITNATSPSYDFRTTPAKKYAESSIPSNDRENSLISVKSGDNNINITEEAVYVLISHGENGQGGYIDETGQLFDDGAAGSYVNEEYPNNTHSGNYEFTSYKSDGIFDDVVRFKGKIQLLKDAGIKYTSCADTDSLYINPDDDSEIFFLYDSGENTDIRAVAEYGEKVDYTDLVTGKCYRKFCEAYGMWSPVPTDCEDITGGSCFGVATAGGGVGIDPDTGAFEGDEPSDPACFCQNEDNIAEGTEVEGAEEAGIEIVELNPRDSDILKYWINLTEKYVAILDENAENNEVYKVNDSSKNCNHLKQASGISQPIFKVTPATENSVELKSLYFDGVDDYMNIDLSDIANKNCTFFIVEKKDIGANGIILSSGGDGLSTDSLEIGYNDSNTFSAKWKDGYWKNKTTYTHDAPYEITYSTSDNQEIKIWAIKIQGRDLELFHSTGSTTKTGDAKGVKGDGILTPEVNGRIGIGLNNIKVYKGEVFEVLGYNHALTTSDIESVLAYLNSKFTVY